MLKDKVAVVTGAGRGIGRAIAKTFAGYGAKVVVNYNGSEERANSLVAEIKEAGGEAVAYKANVADFAEAEGLIKFALEQYGRVDILVNNAGITKDNIMLGMKEEDFDQVININLKGAFNCIKHVYRPMMKQKYGRIINMSSVVGIEGNKRYHKENLERMYRKKGRGWAKHIDFMLYVARLALKSFISSIY